jgi:hypothetical protein
MKMQIREKSKNLEVRDNPQKKTEFFSISGFFEISSKFWVFLEFLQIRDFLEISGKFVTIPKISLNLHPHHQWSLLRSTLTMQSTSGP